MTLDNTNIDRAVASLRGFSGLIPWAGSLVGEVVSQLLPGQRVDRIVDFLRRVDQKVCQIEAELRQRRICRDLDLIEAALYHATRASSEERRERIASLVADSLNREEVDRVAQKQLLDLLSELNDAELIVLQSYGLTHGADADAYREQHNDVLYVSRAHLGSPPEEIDRETIHRSFREHLVRLKLIQPDFRRPRRGEMPEFDPNTGMMKAGGHKITWLGRMVLRKAGLRDDLVEVHDDT